MKKISILIILLMQSILCIYAQDTSIKGTITLSHQGKTTDFAYNKMADAVNAAIDGDTIFLSAGYFEGDFVINKQVAFIGTGGDYSTSENSVLNGKIILKLPDNTKLTARLFEGINFWNTSFTYQSTNIENIVFKKCYVYGYNITVNAAIKSILFDRCNISGGSYFNNFPEKAIARNCKIHGLNVEKSNSDSSWQFTNCTIDPSNYSNSGYTGYFCPILSGTFVNCIIDNDDDDYTGFPLYYVTSEDTKSKASFTNCLFYTTDNKEIFNGATVENAMYYEASANNVLENFTKEQLEAYSFYGNDGTVVGCYGGKNPYTLKISKPVISSSKVHFDKDKKQVQIKMKVSTVE